MHRVIKDEFEDLRQFFQMAAQAARDATCKRAKCGTVIVKDGLVIGSGYNSPPLDDESARTCNTNYDLTLKPKYDKTCCIHAEWRAILNACKNNPEQLQGATLYFMRIDDDGGFTDAGQPYCTVCSRLALECGVRYFALYNSNGADIYETSEYNRLSYGYYLTNN